ncbi:MAG: CHC2 zinc finger domain-containing protein [Desulfobacterota bacterium]|nr:CHC2 zinc finger domain-containing protein [Thermodesulfobacteriota bacterium]
MSSAIGKVYASLLDREFQRELFGGLPGFQRKGTGFIAGCPFHDEALPTLVIYGDRPEYFCFVCSSRGDWIEYLRQVQKMSFEDSSALLARESGIEHAGYPLMVWEHELATTRILETRMASFVAELWSPPGEESLRYLYARGYSTGEIRGMGLGHFPGHDKTLPVLPVPGLVIPYRDVSGRLMGLVHRTTREDGPGSYAPLTSMEGLDDVPYLLYRSRGQTDIIVVEGFFDALLLDQVRLKPVMGVGNGGLTAGMLETAASFGARHFILALGNGRRQRASTAQAADLVRSRGMASSILPIPLPYKDLDAYIRMTCLDHFRTLLKRAMKPEKWLAEHTVV